MKRKHVKYFALVLKMLMNFPLFSSNYSTVKSLSIMIDEYHKICVSLLLFLLCFGNKFFVGVFSGPYVCSYICFFIFIWIEVDAKSTNTRIFHKPHDAMILFDLTLYQSDEQ